MTGDSVNRKLTELTPENNPVHKCYGCQYCFAIILEDDEYDEDVAQWERQQDYGIEDSD